MIATNIGKKFLDAYNKKYETSLSAKDFFVEIYYPLFFDHEKYMMTGGNSPLENPKISWEKIRSGKVAAESKEKRQERFEKLIIKIEAEIPDMSIAIGYPSLDMTATTSGQITNLTLPLKEEEVYYSWIGSGLGIGVQGGLSILFEKVEVLLDIFEGWEVYRSYLNKTIALRGNQINTWNGQWIAHRYNARTYDSDDKTAGFRPTEPMKYGGIEVTTQSWTNIMIGMAQTFPDMQLTGYVYNLGQTNTTIGFIPFKLPQIKRPIELYHKYFETGDRNNEIDEAKHLFGTAFGFTKACQMGSIGINAMEPKGLREYMDKGKVPAYSEAENEKKINFHTYQIWLLAMLNNEKLWERAQQFADLLNKYASTNEKGKKDKSNNLKAVMGAVNKKQFIDNLTTVVQDTSGEVGYLEMAKLINDMPVDNVPYFLTLIRFHFATINKS